MSQPLEKLEKEIQEAIANNGFHVNAISKFCDCEKCKSEGVVQPEFSTDIMDGYVYTAGFSEKGMPEMLFLCGPNQSEELQITKEMLHDRIQDANSYIAHIYKTKGEGLKNDNLVQKSLVKDVWWVNITKRYEGFDLAGVKERLMPATVAYYCNTDFDLLVFSTHIHPH